MKRFRAAGLFFICMGGGQFALSQAVDSGQLVGSSAYRLRSHNIRLDRTSLVEALQNENPTVRWLAASELVQRGDRDILPELRALMYSEPIPEARVNIAESVARLGDPAGVAALQTTCRDKDESFQVRLTASKYINDLGRTGCVGAMLELIGTRSLGTAEALSLLPKAHGISSREHQQIKSAARFALANENSEAREAAAKVLVQTGDVQAVPDLQKAISQEPNDSVRNELIAAVVELQKHR